MMQSQIVPVIAIVVFLMSAGALPHCADAQQSAPSIESEPETIPSSGWTFRNVEVAKLTRQLSRIGIPIPVTLEGRITGGLSVDVPWTSLRDARAWKISGSLTSQQLTIDGVAVKDLAIVMEYRDGSLNLDQLRFRVPDENERQNASTPVAGGLVTGSAQMELVPRGTLSASLKVDKLSVAALSGLVEELPPIGGLLSGSLTAEADVDHLRDLTAWKIAGPVTLKQFTLNASPPANADVQMELSKGVVTARDFNLQIEKTRLASQAKLDLFGKQPWNADSTINADDLPALLQLLSRFLDDDNLRLIANTLEGSLQGTATLSGTLSPITHQASGQAILTNLRARVPDGVTRQVPLKPVELEKLTFDYEVSEQELRLANIAANLADGRVTGEADLSLGETELHADLSWDGVRPNRLLGEPFGGDGTSAGRVRVTVPLKNATDLSQWSVTSNLAIDELAYGELTLAKIQMGDVRLQEGRVTIPKLTANLNEESVSLALTLGVQQPWPVDARFNISQIDLQKLKGLPQLSQLTQTIGGQFQVDGNVSGTLQPMKLTATGSAAGTSLQFDEHRLERLQTNYRLEPNSLTLSDVLAQLYGGQAKGEVNISLGAEPGASTTLEWSEVNAGDLGRSFLGEAIVTGGRSAGTLSLSIPPGTIKKPEKWRGTANVTLGRLDVYDWRLTDIDSIRLALQDGQVGITGLNALLDGEPIQAELKLATQAPWNVEGTLDVRQLRLDRLESVPQFRRAMSLIPPSPAALSNPSIEIEGTEVASRLHGKVDVAGSFQGTIDPLRITADGDLHAEAVQLDRHLIEQLNFDFAVQPDTLTLKPIDARLYGGRITGSMAAMIGDQPGVTGELRWSKINMDKLVAGFSHPDFAAEGTSNGELSLTIPPGQADDIGQWQATGKIDIDRLRLFDWSLEQIEPIPIALKQGQLTLSRLNATLDEQPISAAVSIGVQAPWPVDAEFDLQQLQLARLGSLPPLSMLKDRLSGLSTLTGKASGQLDPLMLSGDGSAEIQDLTIDEHTIDRLSFDYELAEQSLRLARINAAAYNGIVSGKAELPLTPQADAAADVRWDAIDLADLLGEFVTLPFALHGQSNGRLEVASQGGQLQQPETWDIAVSAGIRELKVDDIELAAVEANAKQQAGRLDYQATGRVLGGTLQVSGQRDATASQALPMDFGSGTLSLRRADLAQVTKLWLDGFGEQLRAPTNLMGTWSTGEEGLAWNANASIEQMSLANRVVAQGLSLRLQGLNQQVRLEELAGNLAGGRLVVAANANLGQSQPVDFRVDLRRASIDELLQLVPQDGGVPLAGQLDLHVRGEAGTTWRMRGTAATLNGQYEAVQVRSARFPFSLDWNTETGQLALQSTSGHVTLPSGRVTGKLKVRRTNGLTIDGEYRFHNVGLQSLMRQLGSKSRTAKARLSGSLSISGRNVRSINDIQARLVADLEDAQPMNMPVLSQIRSFVPGVGASGATQFRTGHIDARLHRGVIEISRLSMTSSQLQIYITGNVNLSGRLNLDAVVSSGQGNDPVLAELLLNRLIAASAGPAGVLLLANDYLANRVVQLGIRGTVRQPVIQIKPYESLGEEGVRFFLRQSTGGVSR